MKVWVIRDNIAKFQAILVTLLSFCKHVALRRHSVHHVHDDVIIQIATNQKRVVQDSFRTGLPDGFFSDLKSLFGYILEDLGKENVVIRRYILVIWNILRPLGIFYMRAVGNFVVICSLWYIAPRKIWQPCFRTASRDLNLDKRCFLL
jgi:hypothetical protein